jgi:hypothetical protein
MISKLAKWLLAKGAVGLPDIRQGATDEMKNVLASWFGGGVAQLVIYNTYFVSKPKPCRSLPIRQNKGS